MNIQREHAALAIGLIAIGVLLLVANLGLFSLSIGTLFGSFWPLILIALGIWKLFADRGVSIVAPVVLVGLGAVFLASTLDIIGWGASWPLIIIVVGVAVLLQGVQFRKASSVPKGPDTINIVTIFSGEESRIASQSFRGGQVTAIFGGGELDLREAQLAPGATLNITALFGGVEMKVPESWRVDVHGAALFGGIENKQKSTADPTAPS